MAVKVTTLQFAASTGGGTQNVAHGHGTTPEGALFFFTKATVLETARATSNLGVGFSDGTDDRAQAIRSQDNQATTVPYVTNNNAAIVMVDDSTAATDGVATASFGATNLTLTWSEAPGVAFYIQAVFFSGTDGVKVLDTQLTGATPVAITHNLGLTTSNEALIFCIGHSFTGATWASTRDEAHLSFGVSHWDGTSTFTNRVYAAFEDNGETDGRPAGYLDTGNLIKTFNSNYSELADAAPSDFQTNDFDMTGNSGANDATAFLVIGLPAGIGAWVGDILAPTTLGSKAYTELSWEPQYVGLFTTQIETRDSRRQNLDGDEAGAFGISALDDSQGLSACWALENDAPTTDTQSTVATKAVYMPAHDGSLAASASAGNGCHASFTSLDSTGWTIDTTGKSANSTTTYWIAWAIETASTGTETPKAVAGSITPTGSLVSEALKLLTGSITTTGAIVRDVSVSFAGSITAVGALLAEFVSDVITQDVAGSITASGAFLAQAQKALTGSITATGSFVAKALKSLTGSITSSGTVEALSVLLKSISGSITPTGAMASIKQFNQAIAGSITATGALVKGLFVDLSGSIAASGSLIKSTIKTFTGSITTTGVAVGIRTVLQAIAGSITAVGTAVGLYIEDGASLGAGKSSGGMFAKYRARRRRRKGRR